MSQLQTETRKALHELIDLLREIDERWIGGAYAIQSEADVVEAHRALMHMLQGGLVGHFEDDPSRPLMRRIVTPTRKFTGDNADAIYYDAAIEPGREYLLRGNTAGAVYLSFTIEAGERDGSMGSRTAGVLNDDAIDIAADGAFEVRLGGRPADRNWLAISEDAVRVTTRHYFEEAEPAACNPGKHLAMQLEVVGVPAVPPPPDDASVAAGMRRVAGFVRSRTLGMPPIEERVLPDFVSRTPNQFPVPVEPGDFALAAFDAAYSQAPYLLAPDQALVMRGRWPTCRFANVCLWNRQLQTFDYLSRPVSRNRANTKLAPDGSFRIVIAHQDPGNPELNWIDTEGRPFGMVFWRFFLPEGTVETPSAEVVPFVDLAKLGA